MALDALRGVLRRTSSRRAARRQVAGLRRAVEVLVEARDPVQVRDGREFGGREELPELPASRVTGRADVHRVADRAERGGDLVADRAMGDQHDEGQADGEPEDEDDRDGARRVAERVADAPSCGRHLISSPAAHVELVFGDDGTRQGVLKTFRPSPGSGAPGSTETLPKPLASHTLRVPPRRRAWCACLLSRITSRWPRPWRPACPGPVWPSIWPSTGWPASSGRFSPTTT